MKWLCLALVLVAALGAESIPEARVHRGDNLAWAAPNFDDSGWERAAALEAGSWEENRLWLRMRVEIPAGEPAALVTRACPCEFYLNGVRLGATGDLNARRPVTERALTTFPIPRDAVPGSALLAVRQYHPPGAEAATRFWVSQHIEVVPVSRIGEAFYRVRKSHEFAYAVRLGFLLLTFAIVVGSVSMRPDSVTLLILGYLLVNSVVVALAGWPGHADNAIIVAALWNLAAPVIPMIVFILALLACVPIQTRWAFAYLVCHFAIRLPWGIGLFLPEPAWWTPVAAKIFLVPSIAGIAAAAGVLIFSWRRAGPRLVLIAGIVTLSLNLSARLVAMGKLTDVGISLAGVYFNPDSLASFVFVGLAAAHVVRASRERQSEERRLKSELMSAKSVQSLLLGRGLPSGVDAEYLPASEVGGDFYQVIETKSGLLVVVGDVSGKGLQAAMTVSAIVGALRNRRSDSPAGVLGELNLVLLGGSGFTTCCCVSMEGGELRIANAGHPAPYMDGVEYSGEPSLPLGMSAEARYEESRLPMPGVLTLVSDGVVEAMNAHGELFGFERTREISGHAAREIAETARAWGQNDDITVVTVRSSA